MNHTNIWKFQVLLSQIERALQLLPSDVSNLDINVFDAKIYSFLKELEAVTKNQRSHTNEELLDVFERRVNVVRSKAITFFEKKSQSKLPEQWHFEEERVKDVSIIKHLPEATKLEDGGGNGWVTNTEVSAQTVATYGGVQSEDPSNKAIEDHTNTNLNTETVSHSFLGNTDAHVSHSVQATSNQGNNTISLMNYEAFRYGKEETKESDRNEIAELTDKMKRNAIAFQTILKDDNVQLSRLSDKQQLLLDRAAKEENDATKAKRFGKLSLLTSLVLVIMGILMFIFMISFILMIPA